MALAPTTTALFRYRATFLAYSAASNPCLPHSFCVEAVMPQNIITKSGCSSLSLSKTCVDG